MMIYEGVANETEIADLFRDKLFNLFQGLVQNVMYMYIDTTENIMLSKLGNLGFPKCPSKWLSFLKWQKCFGQITLARESCFYVALKSVL